MSQSPDEAIYHHIHLHTIITHQKGHVPLCQAADTIPCFPPCTKILYKSFYICLHQDRMYIHTCICIYAEREREHSSGQKKQRMRGEILSLVARGKRSLHVCARPRLPLALLVILCCEFPCVKLLQQKNLLSPRPAYAAAACSHTTSARHAVVSREGETWHEATVGRKVSEKCPK